MSTPRSHIDLQTLLAYWLGELDETQTEAVDRHLLGCETCGSQLDGVAELADGLRRAFDAGLVGTVVGEGFVQRLAARGLRLREYRVEPGGSVHCSVAPDDEVVISRLGAPLAGVTRLDLVRRTPGQADVRAADIPFDAGRGEVIAVAPVARLRALPSCVERLRLLAVDASGERLIGDYAFNHVASR